MAFRIGTGSWADPEYKPLLPAPTGALASERLRAYAAHFNHAEVNATAYRTPSPQQVQSWIDQTPSEFTFSVKLHQRFSQNPARAATDDNLIRRTRESIAPLTEAGRFTCFLLVLPATFAPGKHALEELTALRDSLAPHPIAVELRHRGWVSDEAREQTIAFFRTQALVWVAVDMPQLEHSTLMPPVDVVTHPEFAYLRCHGRNALWPEMKSAEEKHRYAYSDSEHNELAGRARTLGRHAGTVHVIANNHAEDYAPRTALALQKLLQPHSSADDPVGREEPPSQSTQRSRRSRR
jgi:uncharacterized protein YecE (DUF72 family)